MQHAAPAKPLEANLTILSEMGLHPQVLNLKVELEEQEADGEERLRMEARQNEARKKKAKEEAARKKKAAEDATRTKTEAEEARMKKAEKEIELAEQTRRQQGIEHKEENVLESLFPGVFSLRSRGPALPESWGGPALPQS